MSYKKLFFPIGGGDELKERLYAALLIAKSLNIKLEVLKSSLKSNTALEKTLLPKELLTEVNEIMNINYKNENEIFLKLFEKIASQHDLSFSLNNQDKTSLINLKIKEGIRSKLVEQESKFCDLVIAAAPPHGISTATFETAVLKSGKPVLMFPRKLKTFSLKSIIIGWNNSTEASRALSSSISFLKKAQKVHIVSSHEYSEKEEAIKNIVAYLKEHDINATYEIVQTTRIPGEALLNAALNGNHDLIVAGAFGHNRGLKELMFGGATRYLLENSTIPVFMSH